MRVFFGSKSKALVVYFLLYQGDCSVLWECCCMKNEHLKFWVSAVKLKDFKPKTASKTPFREPSPAISHLLKFAFSPEKREKTVNVSIRFLTDSKSLRKKVESSAKAVYKKAWLKIVIPLMSSLFFWLIQRELLKQV